MLATDPDKPVIEGGGTPDYFLGAKNAFPAVKVDRVVHHGEIVTLGGVMLTAHLTPGHTKGTTTWTMSAQDSQGRLRHVAVVGEYHGARGRSAPSTTVSTQICASDFSRTFRVLEQLQCEVFLAAHLSAFGGAAKAEAAAQGKGDQAFVDPEGCRASIQRSKKAFEAELESQRSGGRGGARGELAAALRRPPRGLRHADVVERAVVVAPVRIRPSRAGRGTPSSRRTASISLRASVPIRLIISPPRPMTIGFCDSVST